MSVRGRREPRLVVGRQRSLLRLLCRPVAVAARSVLPGENRVVRKRLRLLLDKVEPSEAIELSGGSLEIRLVPQRLHEIQGGEKAKFQDILTTTQQLLEFLESS